MAAAQTQDYETGVGRWANRYLRVGVLIDPLLRNRMPEWGSYGSVGVAAE